MRGKWGRRLVMSAIAIGLAAALVYAFRPQPVPVDLAAVRRGGLTVTVDDEGRTRVKEKYVVSTPVSGRVKRIGIHAGDWVDARQTVLATIQPNDPAFLDLRSEARAKSAVKAAQAARALAEAEVTRAEAELDFAQSEWRRAKSLADRGTISASALDRAALEVRTRRAALATAKASLKVKRYELETAQAALITPGNEPAAAVGESCCVPVRAPVSGRVLRVVHESESVVTAGTALLVIGDPSQLEIVVELLSTDAVRIAKGAEVVVENWGGGIPLAGRVRRIEPYGFTKISALGIEEQRVNVVVDLTDPPERWRALGHGYRVEVRIVAWRGADVLKAPTGALFRRRDEWAVFVLAGDRAALRRVVVGHANDREAEILDGLSEGDRVVLHPSDRIGDGTLIESRDAG